MSSRSLKPLLCGIVLFAATSAVAQTRSDGAKQPEKQGIWRIPGTDTLSVIKTYPANNAANRRECASWQAKLVKVSANQYECRKPVTYYRPPAK